MQNLRFRRYANVFKTCYGMTHEAVDIYRVFYEPSVNQFVGPQLRKDFMQFCFSEYFAQPSLIPQMISRDPQAALICYQVILEANDDPFRVQERFDKRVIDTVFDTTRVQLLGQNVSVSNQREREEAKDDLLKNENELGQRN